MCIKKQEQHRNQDFGVVTSLYERELSDPYIIESINHNRKIGFTYIIINDDEHFAGVKNHHIKGAIVTIKSATKIRTVHLPSPGIWDVKGELLLPL